MSTIRRTKSHLHLARKAKLTRIELSPASATLQLVLKDAEHFPFNPPVVSQKFHHGQIERNLQLGYRSLRSELPVLPRHISSETVLNDDSDRECLQELPAGTIAGVFAGVNHRSAQLVQRIDGIPRSLRRARGSVAPSSFSPDRIAVYCRLRETSAGGARERTRRAGYSRRCMPAEPCCCPSRQTGGSTMNISA